MPRNLLIFLALALLGFSQTFGIGNVATPRPSKGDPS